MLWVAASHAQAAPITACQINFGLIDPPNPTAILYAASGTSGTVIGVGNNNGNRNTGVAYVNGVAQTLPGGTRQLTAVSVAASGYAVAANNGRNNGSVIQYNAGSWSTLPNLPGNPQAIYSVWTYGPTQTYAAADGGVYFYNGATWTNPVAYNPGNGGGFVALWGNASKVYAILDDTQGPTGNAYLYSATPGGAWTTQAQAVNLSVLPCLTGLSAGGPPYDTGYVSMAGDASGILYITALDNNGDPFVFSYNPATAVCAILAESGTVPVLAGAQLANNINYPNSNLQAGSAMAVSSAGQVTIVGQDVNGNALVLQSGNGGAGPWNNLSPVPAVGNQINGAVVSNGTVYYAGQSPTGCLPAPMAYYHMDEGGWSGIAAQVVDSSLNGYNAQAMNSANTAAGAPAIMGNPGTCGYGVFDNTNAGGTINQGYVGLPASFPNLTTNFTVTAWINTFNNTASGQRIMEDDQNNTGGYGISLGDGGTGRIRFYSRAINPVIFDSAYTIANNTWYFVAAVANTTTRKRSIYVFSQAGALLNASTEGTAYSGTWGTDAGQASIGGEVNQTLEPPLNFHFRGNLDEVQVFPAALSQTQLAQIAAQTHPCAATVPDHLVIQSSGSGLTCAASTLTIVACQDTVCTPYTGGMTGTLSASGPVNWDGTTGGTTGAGFVIAAGTSAVTKNVQVATPGPVIFGISSAAPTPFYPTVCNFGNNAPANNNCTFTAASAGFIFSNTSNPGNVYTIPPQVSGIAASGLYLRAVQASTTNAAVCTPAIVSSTTPVNIGYACNNPVACQPGNLATINATPIAPAGTPVSLSFDANGSAPITARYDDVGQITLNANATVTPFGGAAPVTFNGSSNSYTVAPHHFGFSAVSAAPIKAGNNFSATVTAYNGLPTPTATANFGQETSCPTCPEGVSLSLPKCQPTGPSSSNGNFSGNVGAFTGGIASATNLNWSEVGNGDLVATLKSASYLGSGLTATGNTGTGGTVCNGAGNVGPFIPDHFTTVVTPACGNIFTYSGQPFAVQVNAMNGLIFPATAITQNYDGTANTSPNFANTVTLSDSSGFTGGTLVPAMVPATAFSAGVGSVNPTYTFASRTTAPTPINMRATYTNTTPAYTVTSSGFAEGSTTIFSGRAQFNNAHGSENLALPVPFSTQYWFNNGWVTNMSDSCTGDVTLGAANAVSVSLSSPPATCVQDSGNPGLSGAGCAAAGPAAQRFIKGATPGIGFAGNFNLWLKAPGGSNTGAVTVTGNVPVWLQYPWLGGAAINPAARATFGVYKGPNQIIYMRENY
jgi:MSHA biogenesis protein MshQ